MCRISSTAKPQPADAGEGPDGNGEVGGESEQWLTRLVKNLVSLSLSHTLSLSLSIVPCLSLSLFHTHTHTHKYTLTTTNNLVCLTDFPTPKPNLSTRSPESSTLNPQPQTLNLACRSRTTKWRRGIKACPSPQFCVPWPTSTGATAAPPPLPRRTTVGP